MTDRQTPENPTPAPAPASSVSVSLIQANPDGEPTRIVVEATGPIHSAMLLNAAARGTDQALRAAHVDHPAHAASDQDDAAAVLVLSADATPQDIVNAVREAVDGRDLR